MLEESQRAESGPNPAAKLLLWLAGRALIGRAETGRLHAHTANGARGLLEGPGQTVYESPQLAAMMAWLLREGEIQVRGQRVTLEMLGPRLKRQAERIWPRVREEILRTLEQIPYERVVAGGGGVHLFGDLLRELFSDGMVMLEDRFAQAEGH